MKTARVSSPVRVSCLVLVLVLCSCVDHDPYPKNWSSLREASNSECIDVSGTYDLVAPCSDNEKAKRWLKGIHSFTLEMFEASPNNKSSFHIIDTYELAERFSVEQERCDWLTFVVSLSNGDSYRLRVEIDRADKTELRVDTDDIFRQAQMGAYIGPDHAKTRFGQRVDGALVLGDSRHQSGMMVFPFPLIPFYLSNSGWNYCFPAVPAP